MKTEMMDSWKDIKSSGSMVEIECSSYQRWMQLSPDMFGQFCTERFGYVWLLLSQLSHPKWSGFCGRKHLSPHTGLMIIIIIAVIQNISIIKCQIAAIPANV